MMVIVFLKIFSVFSLIPFLKKLRQLRANVYSFVNHLKLMQNRKIMNSKNKKKILNLILKNYSLFRLSKNLFTQMIHKNFIPRII